MYRTKYTKSPIMQLQLSHCIIPTTQSVLLYSCFNKDGLSNFWRLRGKTDGASGKRYDKIAWAELVEATLIMTKRLATTNMSRVSIRLSQTMSIRSEVTYLFGPWLSAPPLGSASVLDFVISCPLPSLVACKIWFMCRSVWAYVGVPPPENFCGAGAPLQKQGWPKSMPVQ